MAFLPIGGGGLAGLLAAQQGQPQQPMTAADFIDPTAIARRRALAEALMQGGQQPVDSGLGAASSLAQTLVGRLQDKKADKLDRQNAEHRGDTLARALAEQNPEFRAMMLAQSRDPELQQLGVNRALSGDDERAKRAREDEMLERKRGFQLEDREAQQAFEREMAGRAHAHAMELAQAKAKAGAPRVDAAILAGGESAPDGDSQTLWEAVPHAVGVANTFDDVWNRIGPQAGGPLARDTARARSAFQLVERDLIRAFSINTRYPVAEQKRILNLVPQASAFESTPNARERLREIDRALERQIADDAQLVQSGALAPKDANEIVQRLQAIHSLRGRIGVPHEAAPARGQTAQAGAPARIAGDDDYDALPSGALFIGPDGVTRRKP